jgi:hypothetical protein
VEDALVFGGVVATAFLMCGGIMMILLMGAALNEPSTSYQTLSAMMAPTLPYFIIANNVLELIVAPGVVFVGWRPGRRRTLLLAAVVGFYVVRIWTHPLSTPNDAPRLPPARSRLMTCSGTRTPLSWTTARCCSA